MEKEQNENAVYCSHCRAVIGEGEDYDTIDGEIPPLGQYPETQ